MDINRVTSVIWVATAAAAAYVAVYGKAPGLARAALSIGALAAGARAYTDYTAAMAGS